MRSLVLALTCLSTAISISPEKWTGTCASGRRQSPVYINPTELHHAMLDKLHFINYDKSGPVDIKNDGQDVAIFGFDKWGDLQPVIFGGSLRERYKLIEIHLHWGAFDFEGSEHTICNRHYPVEAHLVHQKEGTEGLTSLPADGLGVIGVFLAIQQQGHTPFSGLESVLRQLVEPHSGVRINHYSPMTLLPNNLDTFYTYEGSLTTPGCDETVIWTVFAQPSAITKDQLNLLRNTKSLEGLSHQRNYRPTQPLNGRPIYQVSSMNNRPVLACPQ